MKERQPYYHWQFKPNWSYPEKHHLSYGIMNWLITKRFCLWESSKDKIDKEQYRELLQEFYWYNEKDPDTDFSKMKNIELYEAYTHKHFNKFTQFCIHIYYAK